jgi:hypothetical protein
LITEINPHLLLPGAATDAPEVGVIVAREDDDEADLLRVGGAGPEDDLGAGVVDSEYEPEGHVVEVRTVQQNITALEGTLTKAKKACELAKAVVRHSGGGGGGSRSGGSADQEAVVVDPAASTLQKMDALSPCPKCKKNEHTEMYTHASPRMHLCPFHNMYTGDNPAVEKKGRGRKK